MIRFPSKRSSRGKLSSTMSEFSSFISSYNLLDPLLEGACFSWFSHKEGLVLYQIDRLIFSVNWEDHFQGVLILLHVDDVCAVRRPFKFENVWLEVEGFPNLVKG